MTLYHGSNVAITEIDLQKGRKGKDNTYNTEQLKTEMNMKEMMKNKTLLLASMAVALLSACGSDEDLDAVDQEALERGVVKTEFSLSFPSTIGIGTRMEAATVQEGTSSEVFRGIQDMVLIPFSTSTIGATTVRLGDNIRLPKTGETTNIINSYGDFTANHSDNFNHSKVYTNVEIPIGTAGFLFYGRATKAGSTEADHFQKGYTKVLQTTSDPAITTTLAAPNFSSTPSELSFSPVSIVSTNSVGTNGNNLASYLSAVASAHYTDDDHVDHYWSGTKSVAMRSLLDELMTSHAGSSRNVLAAVQKIYTLLKDESDALSTAICTAITGYKVNNENAVSVSEGTLSFVEGKGLDNYPSNLPDGSAYISFTAIEDDHNYAVTCTASTSADNTGLNITDLTTYAYPAELYYHGNSPIHVAGQSMSASYTSTNSWEQVLTAYTNAIGGAANGTVSRTTRSIAISNPVQYGVGRLDLTVQAFKDNTAQTQLDDAAGTPVALKNGDTSLFPLTGVLVGGQKAVGWNFSTPMGSEYTVYDKTILSGIALTSEVSAPNYTLLFETADATSNDDKVKIALEFENQSDVTFKGKNGYIYPGCRFYLVGELIPYKNTTTHYTGTTGDENLIKKAFVQDYKTTVAIQVKSLANAYNVLPDLKLPDLELGLSVNLQWQQGISATITIE